MVPPQFNHVNSAGPSLVQYEGINGRTQIYILLSDGLQLDRKMIGKSERQARNWTPRVETTQQ